MFESPLRFMAGVLAATLPARLWPHLDPYIPVSRASMFSALLVTVGGMLLAMQVVLEGHPRISALLLLVTARGWLSIYLMLSGLLRVAANIAEEPMGDILLTVLDAGWVHLEHGGRTATGHQIRALLEGPAVPDLLCAGAEMGIDGAEIVVVAARKKPEWRVGTAVIIGPDEEWYRIVSIDERTIDRRLRTLYGLVRHGETEAARHVVRYDP